MVRTRVFALIAFFFCLHFALHSKPSDEALFDLARQQLAKREIDRAIQNLKRIYVKDRRNGNINFLLGAAYSEQKGSEEKAIYHLKKAALNVKTAYQVGSFAEKGAPIHTYYYLTIALAATDNCEKAAASAKKLSEYSQQIDNYFIEETSRHLQKCPYQTASKDFEKWLNIESLPPNYRPDEVDELEPIQPDQNHLLANLDSLKKAEMGIVTKELLYTTNAPLYGVQIGSGTKPSPISNYGRIKNVDVFVDKQGIIRYVVGHFAYRNQAEALLERLQAEGHEDAFVVNVNDERKYSNELISYNHVNLRAGVKGEIQYFVQLGAFKDSIPTELMEVYLDVEGIKEIDYEEMTLITIGAYATYQQASKARKEVLRVDPIELREAFIVAFNRGKKISLEDAKNHTD